MFIHCIVHTVHLAAGQFHHINLKIFRLLLSFLFLKFINIQSVSSSLCFSVFLSSYDKVDGPELYMIEPSGISYVSIMQTVFL